MAVVTGFATPPAGLQQVAEAWGDFIDPRELFSGEPDFFGGVGGVFCPVDQPHSRARGEDPPRFRTEHDLARIRGIGRLFGDCSNLGISGLKRLGNYIFGAGFTVSAQAAKGVEVSEVLLAAVQQAVDAFTTRNIFNGSADREIDRRARRDGECVLVLEPAIGGNVDLRFAEPVQLTEPANPRVIEDYEIARTGDFSALGTGEVCWSFGVATPEGRHDKPLGYYLQWSAGSRNWDYLPESRVHHAKRNVDRNVKRGVSDFNVIDEFLSKSERLLASTAHGSTIQASIPFVKEFLGDQSNEKIDQLRNAKTVSRSIATPEGRREIFQQRFAPGTVPHAKGWSFKDGPGGDSRAQGFIAVLQACLRYVGIRWDMPEAMISGDASNANLASSLVAEAPFTKAREADQQVYVGEFTALLWKVLRLSYDMGRFASFGLTFNELQAAIFLKIDVPQVATRDRLKEAQTNEIEKRNGVLSARTWASRSGLDYDAEVDAGAKESTPPPAFGANPADPADPVAANDLDPQSGDKQNTPADDKAEATESESLLRKSLASFRNYP